MNTTTPADTAAGTGHRAPVFDTAYFRRWIAESTRLITRDAARLTELDAVIGDGDHGANLVRGLTAVGAALDEAAPATPGELLVLAGTTLTNTVGGASGPLFGTVLRRAGKNLGTLPAPTPAALATALDAGLRSVRKLGGAEVGDATLVDALAPALHALAQGAEAGRPVREVLAETAAAARAGADATEVLVARKGRASYLGERSVGHQDAGANSVALLMEALLSAVDANGRGPAAGSVPVPAQRPVPEPGPAPVAVPEAVPEAAAAGARVGVVLVSHSAAVAESVAVLSRALLGSADPGPLAVAGGLPGGGVGTSADLIERAVRAADEGRGVAVLCDMGSAVLTVRALLAEGTLPAGTRLVDAPFLEGAVAITLTAALDGDLDAIDAAAADARMYRKI
ncbi:dihydroxyacetone kinase subunit DhaL (plasmid) [Streptomyces sp. BI20]|uniref:dihydroxyacetone kinase subunit DhaL n=1 Tax=Streptomyces sp. BI20 TaxID=3403460 RepID=UPI003C721DA8